MARKTFSIRGNLADALDDTVSSAKNNAGQLHIEIIPLRKIKLDLDNPRDFLLTFEDLSSGITGNKEEQQRKISEKESLLSISNSIKNQGVINPIVVYKHENTYQLIAGERRTLGSILAGKEDIPAKVLTVKPDPLKLSLLQWIENIEREDLTLWERLKNLEKISDAYVSENKTTIDKVTASSLSNLIGCSIQQATNYKALLICSEELRIYIKRGEIKNIEKAAMIAKSPKDIQSQLIQVCIDGNTLSEMKKMAHRGNGFGFTTPKEKVASNKINLGFTENSHVAKAILDSVFQNRDLAKHTVNLYVDWGDKKSISMAFKKLLKSLENV